MFKMRCGIFMMLVYRILQESDSERSLKIGPDLPKLLSKVECIVFWDTLYNALRLKCLAYPFPNIYKEWSLEVTKGH